MQSKQWKHPGSPPPKKFKRVHSAGKVMASIFWNSQGVIMNDYLEQGRMTKGACYSGELRRLCQEIPRRRREKPTCGVLLLQEKVSKGAKIKNQYNQVPHLTQDTNGKVTNSQLDATNESQEVSPFPAADHKAHINRCAQRHSKHKT